MLSSAICWGRSRCRRMRAWRAYNGSEPHIVYLNSQYPPTNPVVGCAAEGAFLVMQNANPPADDVQHVYRLGVRREDLDTDSNHQAWELQVGNEMANGAEGIPIGAGVGAWMMGREVSWPGNPGSNSATDVPTFSGLAQ